MFKVLRLCFGMDVVVVEVEVGGELEKCRQPEKRKGKERKACAGACLPISSLNVGRSAIVSDCYVLNVDLL